jgi:hypothetical protein
MHKLTDMLNTTTVPMNKAYIFKKNQAMERGPGEREERG